MAFCKNCGAEIDEKAVVCVHCGVATNVGEEKAVNDSGSGGWGVLGFFFPIVGLILYLVWKDNKPKTAKMIGKWALIGFIVNLVLAVFQVMAMME